MSEYIVTVNCLGEAETIEATGGSSIDWTAETVLDSMDGMVATFYVYAYTRAQAGEMACTEWAAMLALAESCAA